MPAEYIILCLIPPSITLVLAVVLIFVMRACLRDINGKRKKRLTKGL